MNYMCHFFNNNQSNLSDVFVISGVHLLTCCDASQKGRDLATQIARRRRESEGRHFGYTQRSRHSGVNLITCCDASQEKAAT